MFQTGSLRVLKRTDMSVSKIEVVTHPNGYALELKGDSYFYFTPLELMEGIMYHVGLAEERACNKRMITDMLEAAINWKENGAAVSEIGRYQSEISALRNKLSASEKRCDMLSGRIDDIIDDLRRISGARNMTLPGCMTAIRNVMANYSPKRRGDGV